MITLAQSRTSPTLRLEDFVPDTPKVKKTSVLPEVSDQGLIDGVKIELLTSGSDERGMLHELLTTRDAAIEPIVHVYEVVAEPGSVRAWVYHKHQSDRLCFTNGHFKWALYDIRVGSRTYGKLNILDVGEHLRCRLTIPPYVIHGVKNYSGRIASFINCPTNIYRHDQPDKTRLPYGHPGIPYVFD
jgi:dTDP-4-dehydrorhamnose 3,5-epimerase